MPMLDEAKRLISDRWVDQPDAHDGVRARLQDGRITEAEAERLRQFIDDGFLVTKIDLDEEFTGALDADVERLWHDRPTDVAISPKKGARTSFHDAADEDRCPGYRVVDLHAYSSAARALYLHPQIHRFIDLIFDEKSVAFQSLYFEWGSGQGLHRDPMYVPTDPAPHLLASWVALEDIHPDSGPLMYVPGSHRLPWFEFEPDTIRSNKSDEAAQRWIDHRADVLENSGLEVHTLPCQRGDVFIWHGGLMHGGDRVKDPQRTRKSFVTHYSTRSNYRTRRGDMRVQDEGEWRGVAGTTERLLTEGDRAGFDGPLRGVI